MRNRLDPAGKLYPPDSITHARERLLALDVEMENIRGQLDGTRTVLYTGSYLLWHTRALTKLEEFKNEREQTVKWIEEQQLQLFRDAVKLLRTLVAENVDFTQAEIERIKKYEEALEPQKGE